MPFEDRRRYLMSKNTVDWGAVNTFLSPHGSSLSKSGSAAPEEPQPEVNTKAEPDVTTTPNMEYEITQQTRPKTFVSSRGWTVPGLMERGKSRFQEVRRISALAPVSEMLSVVKHHEESGIPLIIEGWHTHPKWPKDMFTIDWFSKHGQQDAKARNVHDWSDINISLSNLIEKQRALPTWVEPDETERLYGKDAHCPESWTKWLNEANVIPSTLLPEGPDNLLQCLPLTERVETLMCYLGIGDTFTPCHKDLCASSGQNIMCYTENSGSSFWFMTASSDAPAAAKYFHELGKELDLETHVITVEELEKAPFTTYVAEQKLGDMVLVPPRSCHQVVNQGGITIKTSWSRMTLDGLAIAFYHELPVYRRVCRNETYRVKYTIYHALLQCTRDLEKCTAISPSPESSNIHDSRLSVPSSRDDPLPIGSEVNTERRREDELRRLIDLFDDVLAEEYHKSHKEMSHLTMFSAESSTSSATSQEGSSRITCDFCGTDVFQSFFECRKCIDSPPDTMDTGELPDAASDDSLVICSSCYVEGRTCLCEAMHPMQYRPFNELFRDRNKAVEVLRRLETKESMNKYEIMNESNVTSKVELGIFDAALAMYQYRQEQSRLRPDETIRTCIMRQKRHAAHRSSFLPCKKCHSGLCYKHILDLGLHSAEAIAIHQSDSSHISWHECHRDKSIISRVSKAEEVEKDGTRCDVRCKLALTARKFDTCMPSNPRFTKAGWYDKYIQISTIPIEDSEKKVIKDPAEDMETPPATPLSPLSSLTSSPSMSCSDLPDSDNESHSSSKGRTLSLGSEGHLSVRPISLADDRMSVEVAPTQKKRKRQILDCVMIPPLSKLIRSSKPTISRSTSSTQVEGEGEQRAKGKDTDGRSQVDIETSESVSYNPKVVLSPSMSRRLKTAVRRIVISSREATPLDDCDSSSVESEPSMKRARFESSASDSAKPITRKGKAGPTSKFIPQCSGTAVSSGARVRHTHLSNNHDAQRPLQETTGERLIHRSFGKGYPGSRTAPSTAFPSFLPNHSVSQAATTTRPRCCSGEKKSDKRFEFLEKQLEASDRNFRILQQQVKELLQHRTNQDRIDSNHRLKLQEELSKLRQATLHHSTKSHDLILGIRTDIDNLRTQVEGKDQSTMSPTNSTHIVLRDSMGPYLDFEHNNSPPQFGYKSNGKYFPRHDQLNRQFFTHSGNFQGQHPQSPHQPWRDNERFIPPASQSMSRQTHAYIKGNQIESSREISHNTSVPNAFPQGNWRDNEGWLPQSSYLAPHQDHGSHNNNMFNSGTQNSNWYHRERNNDGWTPRSMSHQNHGYDNANKFNRHPYFNGRGYWRDHVTGPSKPHYKPMKKWSRREAPQELLVPNPNNIDIQPALSSKNEQEQECSTESAGAPEHSMSPTLIEEAKENHRELTPSEHWEDEYDQTEEPNEMQHIVRNNNSELIPTRARTEPSTRTEPPTRTTTPADSRLAPDDSMESNPWVS